MSTAAAYVDLVCGEMLEACAPRARWVDVFCEVGAFDADETRHILKAGIDAGLEARLHANQLTESEGVQIAVELGAASADHCTHLTPADIDALAASDTVATLLPLVEFSTRSPYPPARPCSTPARLSRSPRTATRDRASRPPCRWRSRWPCGRCA